MERLFLNSVASQSPSLVFVWILISGGMWWWFTFPVSLILGSPINQLRMWQHLLHWSDEKMSKLMHKSPEHSAWHTIMTMLRRQYTTNICNGSCDHFKHPQKNGTCPYLFPLLQPTGVLFRRFGQSQVPAPPGTLLWGLSARVKSLRPLVPTSGSGGTGFPLPLSWRNAKMCTASPEMSLQPGGKDRHGHAERNWSKKVRNGVREGWAKR